MNQENKIFYLDSIVNKFVNDFITEKKFTIPNRKKSLWYAWYVRELKPILIESLSYVDDLADTKNSTKTIKEHLAKHHLHSNDIFLSKIMTEILEVVPERYFPNKNLYVEYNKDENSAISIANFSEENDTYFNIEIDNGFMLTAAYVVQLFSKAFSICGYSHTNMDSLFDPFDEEKLDKAHFKRTIAEEIKNKLMPALNGTGSAEYTHYSKPMQGNLEERQFILVRECWKKTIKYLILHEIGHHFLKSSDLISIMMLFYQELI